MTLGQRIQELRKGLGLSQEELGERMGVSRQAISKWEGDQTIPELDNLIALSRLFGLTVGQLLGVEQPVPTPPAAPAKMPRRMKLLMSGMGAVLAVLSVMAGKSASGRDGSGPSHSGCSGGDAVVSGSVAGTADRSERGICLLLSPGAFPDSGVPAQRH